MNGFTIIGCAAVAIIGIVYLGRPVSRSEKALLLILAEGEPVCQEIADELAARKWLTWTKYDDANRSIERIKYKRERNQILAGSIAQQAVRDAQRKA